MQLQARQRLSGGSAAAIPHVVEDVLLGDDARRRRRRRRRHLLVLLLHLRNRKAGQNWTRPPRNLMFRPETGPRPTASPQRRAPPPPPPCAASSPDGITKRVSKTFVLKMALRGRCAGRHRHHHLLVLPLHLREQYKGLYSFRAENGSSQR